MNTTLRSLSWKGMALEGGVIVLSILLAFSIDAWWDQRKEDFEHKEQLTRVLAELRVNSEIVRSKIETLQFARDAAAECLSWIGPEPPHISADTFFDRWNSMLGIGTFSLVRRAADDYLAAGRKSITGQFDVRDALSKWYFASDRLEAQYGILRSTHWTLMDHLNRLPASPGRNLAVAHSAFKEYGPSKFPFDQSALLRDPVLESLVADYMLRLRFVHSGALEQEALQAELVTSIESEIAE